MTTPHPISPIQAEGLSDLEEAVRLAEVGEYLYDACAYSYGDGHSEPREYGIEWHWQQSKPNEYGQGKLLAAATKWHEGQGADGTVTEASKLRAALSRRAADHPTAVGVTEEMVEVAARAVAAKHYADRFKKPETDPHVTMNVDGNWSIFAREARIALKAAEPLRPAPEQAGGEVVAWMWTYSMEEGGRMLGPVFGREAPNLLHYPNAKVTPLYASPPSPAATQSAVVSEEMVERIADALYGTRGVAGRVVGMSKSEAYATARLALAALQPAPDAKQGASQ